MLKTFLLIFGIIVIAGGIQGYVVSKSMASIIAAGILGGLLLASSFMLGSNTTVALVLALIGALGIAGRFVPAFIKAGDKVAALWPAGVLSVLSVIALVLVIKALVTK